MIASRVMTMLEVGREQVDLAIRPQDFAALVDARGVEDLTIVWLDRTTDND